MNVLKSFMIMKKQVFYSCALFFTLTMCCISVTGCNSNVENTTVLPLEFNTGNPEPYGMPSTVISIQGKQLPVILDTGAYKSEVTLTPYALQGLQVRYTGKQVCSKALDGEHCEKEFIIPKLKIGDFTVNNVKGTLMHHLWGGHDEGFIPTEASRNGIIGYQLISKFNVLLDYQQSQAIFLKKHTQLDKINFSQWIKIPFKDHLMTTVEVNGKLVSMSWDTGAIPSIIRQTSVNNMKHERCPEKLPFANKNCYRVKTTEIIVKNSKKNLPNTWFLIQDIPKYAPFDALIGSNFFRDNLVYFDFNNITIYVKPNKAEFKQSKQLHLLVESAWLCALIRLITPIISLSVEFWAMA